MLRIDLVRVRRRAGRLDVVPLQKAERARLHVVAEQFVAAAASHVGRTRRDLEATLEAVPIRLTDYKRVQGLRKLVLDRCHFAARNDVDPVTLRRTLFARAAAARRTLGDGARFDRESVLEACAVEVGLSPAELDPALFSDVKENHVLTAFDVIAPGDLLDWYESSQSQALLLRATRLVVQLRATDPEACRRFFWQLKFRRLLYTLRSCDDGTYRVEIDGPMSLFRAVTRYGLQLALILPALERCGPFELEADVLWGKDREPLRFCLESTTPRSRCIASSSGDGGAPTPASDAIDGLRVGFERLHSHWCVEPSTALLDLPGMGLCVPDLVFTHETGAPPIYFEVLGYWSRDAVWRRVDLIRAGLPHAILFAVSERLRVSEAVLDRNLPGQLIVYKGVLSPRVVLERLEQIRALHSA